MAIKGLSRFVVCGGYAYDDTTGKYQYDTDAAVTEKLVSYKADINVGDDNPLYGDNGIAETDGGRFQSGSLTISTTELTNDTSKLILNVKDVTLSVDSKSVSGLAYERDTAGNVVGVALIEEHQHHDENFYRAVIMPKVKFSVPSDSATTRGESVDWQTPEISGTIMYAEEAETDKPQNVWKETYDFDTEAAALAGIKAWFTARKKTVSGGS